MTKVGISVIIPVFNAMPYLRQCLDSVLAHKTAEVEVICVDDCSTDESPQVLSGYQEKDARISVIHNAQRLGAGRCRNLGLECAQGEYLLFMDADDWLFPDSLNKVLAKARRHRVDVLRCRAADYDNRSGNSTLSPHNALKKVPFFLFGRVIDPGHWFKVLCKACVAPWGGLVRREFLMNNGIRFNSLVCVNDRSFYWETVLKAERIVFTKDFLIHYRINLDSSLVGNRIRNFFCHFESYRLVCALCENLPNASRRCILNAELLDMVHWAERSADTEYAEGIWEMLKQFLATMDRSPWDGRIEGTRWRRRLERTLNTYF